MDRQDNVGKNPVEGGAQRHECSSRIVMTGCHLSGSATSHTHGTGCQLRIDGMREGPIMDVTAGSELEQDNSDISGQAFHQLGQILTALTTLQGSFDSKIRYDEAKERQIAALHQELLTYRQGLYQQILRPVLTDLIGIYDEIASQVAASQSDDTVRGSGFCWRWSKAY